MAGYGSSVAQQRTIALLRGINVGGHNKLPMAELRAVFAELGHDDVATYIQSGNVVFTPGGPVEPDAVSGAIAGATGVSVPVVIRTADDLVAARAAVPFDGDPKQVVIGFYDQAPAEAEVARLAPDAFTPDRWAVIGSEVHLHYPNGQAGTKMTVDRVGFGRVCTARNLRTVDKLLEMLG